MIKGSTSLVVLQEEAAAAAAATQQTNISRVWEQCGNSRWTCSCWRSHAGAHAGHMLGREDMHPEVSTAHTLGGGGRHRFSMSCNTNG